jgi:hypothetical protein
MVFCFQLKIIISFKGLSCLHLGHLILIKWSKEIVKSKNPQMMPKNKVSKMRVSIDFYDLSPLTKYWREHLTSVATVRRTRTFCYSSPD